MRMRPFFRPPSFRFLLAAVAIASLAACSDGGGGGGGDPSGTGPVGTPDYPTSGDPGAAEWQPVASDRVAGDCGLDPDLLAQADALVQRPWAVIRYGKLCHEFYPDGPAQTDEITEIFSTTKTLGAVATGVAAWQTRDLQDTGRKTGPLSDADRVDHWLDEFSFNPDARVGHVLAMLAQNPDLSFGHKEYSYDVVGKVQINRLSDVVNTAIAQDPARFGGNIEEFTQRFLFQPLGMTRSQWSGGSANKIFAYSWTTTVREMARLGLMLVHGGVWSGERILGEDWVYKMTHPSFEDANTAYGYLTWLNSASNHTQGLGDPKADGLVFDCAPLAVNFDFPHGLSEAADCGYSPAYSCDQEKDVGLWYAAGLFGQYIIGQRALDLVLVVKDFDGIGGPNDLWRMFRPALIAEDAKFAGDQAAFCDAYARGAYAPDLH